MDKDSVFRYSPIAIVVISLLIQWHIFVTPEKLEIKHREILKDVSQTYSTKEQYNDLKDQIASMQQKLDKIYDVITKNR